MYLLKIHVSGTFPRITLEVGPNRMRLGYISSQWISAILTELLLLFHLCSVGGKNSKKSFIRCQNLDLGLSGLQERGG